MAISGKNGWRESSTSLNPSFSGIWPVALARNRVGTQKHGVLILLLVEYGLWPGWRIFGVQAVLIVLILLLVEYGLWHIRKIRSVFINRCLNPSFSGIWPVAAKTKTGKTKIVKGS